MLNDAAVQAVPDAISMRWEMLSLDQVEAIAKQVYGLAGHAQRLPSERDETFKFSADDGRCYTLKIANPAEQPAALSFQNDVLLHLEVTAPLVPVPRVIPTLQGGHSHDLCRSGEAPRAVRMLSYLDGRPLYTVPETVQQSFNLGRALALLGKGIAGAKSRPPNGKLLWDISHTLDLVEMVRHVSADRQDNVHRVLAQFERSIPHVAGGLRQQIIHNDCNPHNILVDPSSPDTIVGVIDFGDMVHAPLVNDIAVAVSYRTSSGNWMEMTRAILHGYCAETPLDRLECALLAVLIKARLAMTIVITEWRAANRPENREYILRNNPSAWRGLQNMLAVPDAELDRFLLESCGA